MARIHRLLELLQELRARRRPVAATVLAATLGVSLRTLYRDIAVLRAQGARIEGEPGLGYVLRPGFMLPPLMFTPEEMEVLLLGAAWVGRRADLAMQAPARHALAKIAAVMPRDQADALDAAGLLLAASSRARPTGIDARLVRDALRRERKLVIGYVDAAGLASERVIWPVAIGVYEDTQLLAAWCEWRGDFRHFRLDRIGAVRVLEARMPRRRAVLYAAWRERERACMPDAPLARDAA